MNTTQHQNAVSSFQEAVSRFALSLDSFVVNGIQFGVLQRAVFGGFLEHNARQLLNDLASLESQVELTPVPGEPHGPEVLATLRLKCQQLIDLVTALGSFRTFATEQMRAAVSRIAPLREACIELLQKVESNFHSSQAFCHSRPPHSIAAVNDFLANLERAFIDARAESHVPAGEN